MFILDGQHSFRPDPRSCHLWASIGYSEEILWGLSLGSEVSLTRFASESDDASFGIDANPPLDIRSWRQLPTDELDIPSQPRLGSFWFHCGMSKQWEDINWLRLRFGRIDGPRIEVWANGQGCVEHAPGHFPDGTTEFQIQTWVEFRGVGVNIPLNAGNPIAYAESKVRTMLPTYEFARPVLRQTNDTDAKALAIEVLFGPVEAEPRP